ncbi:helix-turn-helix domain-containing protein [Paenibacillus sp. GCM10027629]|uniref:helix-turn-helix domain-containing protein n=1 Tax=Paenibacillus sp. GCM10027629 TaxID=3273414 RepID=UPI00363624B6
MSKEIGAMIKGSRERRNLSVSKLASITGLAESTVRQIENGKHLPKLETLHKLEKYINIDSGEIYTMMNYEKFSDLA